MQKNKGFSLTEMMIVVGLLSIISVPLYFILSDSSKRAQLIQARDYIKQEANKTYKILENDLTQAKRGTFSQKENEFSIKVRTEKRQNAIESLINASISNDETLKYTFNKPKLYREFEKQKWLVSDSVESITIEEPSPIEQKTSPGKLTVNLVMKSVIPGLRDDEQPVYEQSKVIVMMEDAAYINDPNWLEIGTVGGLFQTSGNLLADLKEQFEAIGNDFTGVWAGALGDIQGMTVDQLKDKINSLSIQELQSSFTDIGSSLNNMTSELKNMNTQIDNMDWHALYNTKDYKKKVKTGWFSSKKVPDEGRLNQYDANRKAATQKVNSIISGYKSSKDMNWDTVRNAAKGFGIDGEAIDLNADGEKTLKSLFDAKKTMLESQEELQKAKSMINDQILSLRR